MTHGSDIVAILQADHNEIRGLFARLDTTPVDQRLELFQEVVTELARHETAEEVILYPTLREETPEGEKVSGARLFEERDGEQLMAAMEYLDPASDEFLERFRQLRDDVEQHASNEEREVFPRLVEHCDEEQRHLMGEALAKAKTIGPTQPYPQSADSPPALAAMGAVGGMFTLARDAARKALRESARKALESS